LRVGPPVWLPLARREEITAAPHLHLISERCKVRAASGFLSSCSSRSRWRSGLVGSGALRDSIASGLQPPQDARHRVELRQGEGRGLGQVVKTAQHHGEVGERRLLARLDDEGPPCDDPPIDHAKLDSHLDLATRNVGVTSDAGDERVMSEPIDGVLTVAKQHGVGTLDAQVGARCCQNRSGRCCGEVACNIITPRQRHGCNGSAPRACTPTTVGDLAAPRAMSATCCPPGEGMSTSS